MAKMTPNEQVYWNLLMHKFRGTPIDIEEQREAYEKLTTEEIEHLWIKYADFCEKYHGWGE